MSQRFRQQRPCPPGKAAPAGYSHKSQCLFVATPEIGFLRPSAILKQITHS